MQKWTIIIGKGTFTISKWQTTLLLLPIFFILSFSIYSYGNIVYSTIININILRLQREKRFYIRQIFEINDLLEEIEKRDSRIFRFDETMRLAVDIPKSEDIRMLEIGGRHHQGKGGRILDNKAVMLNKRLDRIEEGITRRIKSLDEIEYTIRNSRKRLMHTPSIMPTQGRITSGFGWRRDPFTRRRAFHSGIDIANRKGTPVLAAASGEVVYIGKMGGYGLCIKINHGYGYTSVYGHLKSVTVELYDRVERRDIIGYMGASGRATDSHLHYTIKKFGKDIDPMNYILCGNAI